MGELNKSFPPTPPFAIASFNFIEFVSGLGIVSFICSAVTDVDSTDYILSTTTNESNPGSSNLLTGAGQPPQVQTLIFESGSFKQRATILGTTIVSFSRLVTNAGGSTGGRATTVIKIVKWDGSSETVLGSSTSTEISAGSASTTFDTTVMKIPLTKTNFKIGDTLRVKAITTLTRTSTGLTNAKIAHDPLNGDQAGLFVAADNTTIFKAQIAFKTPK